MSTQPSDPPGTEPAPMPTDDAVHDGQTVRMPTIEGPPDLGPPQPPTVVEEPLRVPDSAHGTLGRLDEL